MPCYWSGLRQALTCQNDQLQVTTSVGFDQFFKEKFFVVEKCQILQNAKGNKVVEGGISCEVLGFIANGSSWLVSSFPSLAFCHDERGLPRKTQVRSGLFGAVLTKLSHPENGSNGDGRLPKHKQKQKPKLLFYDATEIFRPNFIGWAKLRLLDNGRSEATTNLEFYFRKKSHEKLFLSLACFGRKTFVRKNNLPADRRSNFSREGLPEIDICNSKKYFKPLNW